MHSATFFAHRDTDAVSLHRRRAIHRLVSLHRLRSLHRLLSRLLLQEPNLLLLDEPTNHLDIDSIVRLESYFKDFKGRLILISHNRAFLERNATRVWELERKK